MVKVELSNKNKTIKKIINLKPVNFLILRTDGLYRTLRRKFYVKFRKKYVLESLKKRKGKCRACGCCATMLFPCEYYDKKTKLCRLWEEKGKEAIPYLCKLYPFDEKDKIIYSKINCGFYWEKIKR